MVARRSIRTEGWFEQAFERAPASVATDANDDTCSRNTENNMCGSSRLDSECTQAMVGVGAAIPSARLRMRGPANIGCP